MYKLQKAELMQTLSIALGERLSQHISAKAEHNDGFHESSPSFSCFLTKLVTLNLDSVTRSVIEGEILELCKKHKIRNGERDLHVIKSCAWTVQYTFVEEMVGKLHCDMVWNVLENTCKRDGLYFLQHVNSFSLKTKERQACQEFIQAFDKKID
jgi:hypothetical protein